MNNDSPLKALIVVTGTALLCSILVTVTAVTLDPIQRAYADLERIRFLVGVSGLTEASAVSSDLDIISAYQSLEPLVVDLDRGKVDPDLSPDSFDAADAATNPDFAVTIPKELDVAGLGERSSRITIYIVRDDGGLSRVILPIYGQGMWSTIYGYIALENDFNTIADITFYEQGETAGIGDEILDSGWQANWQGQKLYDDQGVLRFRIGGASVDASSAAARHRVDAISGATVTTDAVTSMIRYWFGAHGFEPFIENYQAGPQP